MVSKHKPQLHGCLQHRRFVDLQWQSTHCDLSARFHIQILALVCSMKLLPIQQHSARATHSHCWPAHSARADKGHNRVNNMASGTGIELLRCEHQVGGHMAKDQTPDTFVDTAGRFYKPYQVGDRKTRESAFYALIWGRNGAGNDGPGFASLDDHPWGQGVAFEAKPGTAKPEDVESIKQFVPKSYGVVELEGREYLVMEDIVGANYKHPSVMDLKMGFVTGYPWATEAYKEKCKGKDETSTQGSCGFRISGMQVYDPDAGVTNKSDRQYGKTLNADTISEAFLNYAGKLGPAAIYLGKGGVLEQVEAIREWFGKQRSFCFYQASLLFVYDGSATDLEGAKVQVRLIDFAHTYPTNGEEDKNFIGGLDSLIKLLKSLA